MDQPETVPILEDTEMESEQPDEPTVLFPESPTVVPYPVPWSFAKRFLFRFAFVYFLLYTHPFPLGVIPNPASVAAAFSSEPQGEFITDPVFEGIGWYMGAVQKAQRWAVDTTASGVFGFDETLDRPFGSGDPTFAYVQLVLYVALALLVAGIWSYLARRRRDHARLAPWLHLAVRYNLAFTMFGYGFAKVFPAQFSFPRLSRLVSDYGDSSPMNVLWSFMGSSPAYTVFAGAGEVLAGVLLCFRRTSTLGALVAAGVLANVAAMNYCYDVPVKLYSSHLLLFALLLTLPDARRLLNTFFFNHPTEPRDLSSPRFRWMTGHVIKLLVVGTSVTLSVKRVVESYTADDDPGAHYGIWDVERFAEKTGDGTFVDATSGEWLALLIEKERRGRGGASLQVHDHTLRGASPKWNDERTSLTLSGGSRWSYQEDGDTLVLQGEFQRTFREVPFNFKDPGTPRAPQVEIELRRAEDANGDEAAPGDDPEAPLDPAPPVSEEPAIAEPAIEKAVAEEPDDAEDAPQFPTSLVGRWTVARHEIIGDTYTSRRSDPTGWTAVTLTTEGTATFEFESGLTETYELTVNPDSGLLRFSWTSEFEVDQKDADALVLRGEHRGRMLEIELARRDLDSFLLVRRGYHWINEIPLNRY